MNAPSKIDKLRDKLKNSLNKNIKNQEVRAILGGMIFGDISQLSKKLEALFKNTGLYHLLIVSGYQVMLLYFLVRWCVFRVLSKNLKHSGKGEFISTGIALFISINYLYLCGSEPPIKRALVFLFVLAFCRVLTIPLSSFNLILATAILVIVIDPGSQFTPSFHLTFSALLGFILSRSPLWGVVFASILTSIVSLIWFNQLPMISVLANILLAPLFTTLSLIGGGLTVLELLFEGLEPLFFFIEQGTLLVLYPLKLFPISEAKWLALPYSIIVIIAAEKEFRRLILQDYIRKIFRKRNYSELGKEFV